MVQHICTGVQRVGWLYTVCVTYQTRRKFFDVNVLYDVILKNTQPRDGTTQNVICLVDLLYVTLFLTWYVSTRSFYTFSLCTDSIAFSSGPSSVSEWSGINTAAYTDKNIRITSLSEFAHKSLFVFASDCLTSRILRAIPHHHRLLGAFVINIFMLYSFVWRISINNKRGCFPATSWINGKFKSYSNCLRLSEQQFTVNFRLYDVVVIHADYGK